MLFIIPGFHSNGAKVCCFHIPLPESPSVIVFCQEFNPLISFLFVLEAEPASPALWEEFPVTVQVLAWKSYDGGVIYTFK